MTPPLEFYGTVAQIIPVLLLVLGLELRAFEKESGTRWRGMWSEVGVLIILLGIELRALAVLAEWLTPRSYDRYWMIGSIGIELVFVAIGAILGIRRSK